MTRYVRRPDVEAAPMLEETVLYSPVVKRFCVLNATAACVWESLAQPQSADALETRLRERFAAPGGADVGADVRSALQTLQDLQLVTPMADA